MSTQEEGVIKFDPISSVPTISSNPFRDPEYSKSESTGNFIIRLVIYSAGGIFVIVLIIGSFIFVRAKQRQ